MIEAFSYAFIQRAFIVGLLVSLCSSLLGVSLVLRRYSMIGDGLSHVGFGALAVASVLSLPPMAVTIPVVVIAAVLLLRLNAGSRISGDSAIALVAASCLALGVVLISYVKGTNTDINNFLFGSLLAVSRSDMILSVIVSVFVIASYVCLYPLSALTIVLGMRMLGSLLVSALVIFPCLSAMRIAGSYRAVTLISLADSVVCFILGFWMSYSLGTPAGASIVVVHLCVFLILTLAGRMKERGLFRKAGS